MPSDADSARYDVLGIGNAIVDVIARADDDFLVREGVAKGGMMLIDEARGEHLLNLMEDAVTASGGSAANTIAGVLSFGGRGAYVGKVRDDALGARFAADMAARGISFRTAPAPDGPATARSFIIVTPDGQRTMNTFLGACQNLGPADVDPAEIAAARITYLEGYLWDPAAAKDAFRKAAEAAHAAGRQVALTLSDGFCVDRYRDEFTELLRSRQVDIVFANTQELQALYQTADFATALSALRQDAALAVVTRGEAGALAVRGGETAETAAYPVEAVVDTTGAGDLFAAGFLFGQTHEAALGECLRLGALAAAEVISHVGPRPEASLSALAREQNLAA